MTAGLPPSSLPRYLSDSPQGSGRRLPDLALPFMHSLAYLIMARSSRTLVLR